MKSGGIILVSDTDAKVSVIIPVYNGEKYLDNCIKSVADQTYENLEIIIIDDGSTDRTVDICEEWKEKDDRVRVLHKPNGGRGSARNAGLSMATGDYIHFVDADDWIEKDAIESLYKAMIKNNSDIVIGNMTSYNQSEKMYNFFIDGNDYYEKNYTPEEWFKNEYVYDKMLRQLFVVAWAKLYKRELFKNIYYTEKDHLTEDDPTTWKIYLLANKITYINYRITIHRMTDDHATTNDPSTKLFAMEPVAERIAFLKILGFDTSNEEEAYLTRLHISMNNALKEHDLQKYNDAKQYMEILKKYHKD